MSRGFCLKSAAVFLAVSAFSEIRVFCSSPENGQNFTQSAGFYERGEYKKAMLGFMDVLIEEPGNAAAARYLRDSGAMLDRQEKNGIIEEKDRLLREAAALKAAKARLRENQKRRLKAWKSVYSDVVKLAGSPETLREAVLQYEVFLKKAPAYSDGYARFTSDNAAIKKRFYKTMKSCYPVLFQNRDSVDARDLATLFFATGSESDSPYKYVNTQGTEQMLGKMQEVSGFEITAETGYKTASDAFRFYADGKYEISLGLWNQLLAGDPSNEEAVFYQKLAEGRVRESSDQAGAARLYEQGVREFSAGDYAAAVKSWRDCIALEPGNKKAELGLKKALEFTGEKQ
ncbi:MAG: hypothetical protein NTX59_14280 [Elusimicrobia bacterium]|nr:hypothetical protein [Elusimicrobiota bacterium]